MPAHVVPDDHRMEYNKLFEQLWRYAQDADANLPMLRFVLKDDDFKKLVTMVRTSTSFLTLCWVAHVTFFVDHCGAVPEDAVILFTTQIYSGFTNGPNDDPSYAACGRDVLKCNAEILEHDGAPRAAAISGP